MSQGIKDFPHPNPHFPPPPLPARRLGMLGALLSLLAAVAVWAVMAGLVQELPFGVIVLLLMTGLGFLVFAVLATNDRLQAGPWREGRILPARVYIAPKGPPSSFLWHLIGLFPLTDILFGMISGWITGRRNFVHMVWMRNGTVETVQFQADRLWKFYRDNLDVWVCVTRKGKLIPIETIAPRRFHRFPVPTEVSGYLDSVVPESLVPLVEHRKEELVQEALRRAAKANSKAARRTRTHERRLF